MQKKSLKFLSVLLSFILIISVLYVVPISVSAKGKNTTTIAKTYTVSYKLNGGKNNKSNPKSYTAKSATKTLKNPTKKGYTFKGWYSDKKLTKKVTKIKKGSTGNRTFYAKWSKNSYKITYKLNGGKNNAKNPKKYTVTTNTVTLKKPTKKGYIFEGWYSDKKLTKKVAKIKKGSTGNKVFYAKWTPAEYKITYNLSGGENNPENPDTYTVNTAVLLKKPTKTGYIFEGWYSDKELTKKVEKIENGSTGNKTIYAKWKTINSSESTKTTLTPAEKEMLRLINESRKEAGLKALTFNYAVYDCAEIRVKELTMCFDHIRPHGGTGFETVFTDKGVSANYHYFCENIGANMEHDPDIDISVDYAFVKDTHNGFMESPGHRANILNPKVTSVAFAFYDTEQFTYVEELFLG